MERGSRGLFDMVGREMESEQSIRGNSVSRFKIKIKNKRSKISPTGQEFTVSENQSHARPQETPKCEREQRRKKAYGGRTLGPDVNLGRSHPCLAILARGRAGRLVPLDEYLNGTRRILGKGAARA